MKEVPMTINGTPLTNAQAMTMRVALESFAMSLTEDGLGTDAVGVSICNGYLARIGEMRSLMYRKSE